MKGSFTRFAFSAALALVGASSAVAQSAEQVVEEALARFEARIAGVDNYTVVQEVMGYETSDYYEKRMIDGRPLFVLVERYGDGSQQDDLGGLYNDFVKLAKRAKLQGKEKVDGHEVFELFVNDFSGLELEDRADDFKPKEAKFYLDTREYVLRRMVMDGEYEADGAVRQVSVDAVFGDYREVDGMLHPFLTEMKMSGLNSQLSEKELEEARKSLKELREQMANMPESQRKMMESMVGGQIEKLEEMVNSGNLDFTLAVKELRVNAGPPE